MGSEDSAQTPEKPSKSSSTTSAAATPTKHSSSGHTEASNSSSARKKLDSHLLLRHQGQKWQNVFDFDKILKQLRVAEKQLKHRKCEYFGTNNVCQGCNADPGPNALQADSPPRAVKQVQRLDSRDMHYYGIVGNRSMLDIIVCNVCGGSYTKMGFNNHMMLHHPSVWSSISTKVELPQVGSEASVRLLPSAADTVTTLGSEAAASSASVTASASESGGSTTSRHKSKKGSSKSGSSSSSTGRSRSKSKHHSSSSHSSSSKHSSSVVVETKPAAEVPSSSSTSSSSSKKSGKNGKKGSSSSSAAAAAATANAVASSSKDSKSHAAAGYSVIEPSHSSLSSTSSSSSTTTTPKKSATPTLDSLVAASSANDAKEKVLTEKMSPIPSKKKSKSSSHSAPQESLDLAAASSATVFERPASTAPGKSQKSSSNSSAKISSSTASSSSYSTAKGSSSKKSKSEQKRSSSSNSVADVAHQLSELDRAVSSITAGQEIKREPTSSQAEEVKSSGGSSKSGKTVAAGAYRKPPLIAELKKEIKTEPAPSKYDGVNTSATSGMTQDAESPLNNTILTFDDMLDNKFINEILGNAETELSYNEQLGGSGNDSNGSLQHQAYNQHKPPASKRMRFDDQDSSSGVAMSQSMEMSNNFAIFQQQQQPTPQQQFANYNGPAGVMEDIKLYNSPQSANQPMEYQPQMHVPPQILQNQDQMDTIETNQLQQILYQQQQQGMFHENGAKVAGVGEMLQQPQFQQSQYCPEAGDMKAKSMELCTASEQDVKLEDYATLTAINNSYGDGVGVGMGLASQPMVESEFQLYNVPSITDDASAMPSAGQQQDIIVNNMRLRCDPQYVLPQGNGGGDDEQHLIYEITGNNQVSVLRQHQVIAELLNQAGYENVEYMNVATPTAATATSSAAASSAAVANGADESSEWFDFDFSHIETAKTVLGSSSGSSSSSQIKPAKSEFSNLTPLKFHDDFYANVHVYARIPRPLALNTFGLVKLPWSVASTFRKQIVSSRKANHSPINLNMAGGPNALAARGAKASHNYFTALSASTPGSSPISNNEFSIGSITITNSHNPPNAAGAAGVRPQGQQNGHIEISLNPNAANNPTAAHSKLRQRMAGMMASPSGPIGSSLASGGVTTSIGAVHCGSPSTNVRTVFVQNSPNALRNREPVVKRCVIASQTAATAAAAPSAGGQDPQKPPRKFTAKQISEFLTSGRRIFEQQASTTPTPPMPPPAVESCPQKMVRMNNFY